MDTRLWTGGQARDIDRLSIESFGMVAERLMEDAGRAVFHKTLLLRQPYQKILILAGPGNNGGDALVAARLLHLAGFACEIFSIGASAPDGSSRETLSRQQQRRRCEELKIDVKLYQSPEQFAAYTADTLVIDGVLGLGVQSPLREGLLREALTAAASLRAKTVLAIDLPSGLQADSWIQPAPPLAASHTITFGALKPLHALAPSRAYCGKVSCVPLAFHPQAIAEALAIGPRLSCPGSARVWDQLPADAHKYSRGHVLVIGGSPGKGGAPLLAAAAAMRAGAGWVSVAALSENLAPPRPSYLTYENFAENGQLSWASLQNFLQERRVKAVLIGPGTMANPLSQGILKQLAAWTNEAGGFLILDAGALRGLRSMLGAWRFNPERTLLTPHPGEWRAIDPAHEDLASLPTLEAAWDFCEATGVTLCYKSATPMTLFIQNGQRSFTLNTQGDQRLAKAGSGDILAGVALAFGAAGLSASQAAYQAQNTVAAAARLASQHRGFHGLIPDDIIAEIGLCLNGP